MSLFAVADGIKVRTRIMKKEAGKIRSLCKDIDKLKKKIHSTRDEVERGKLVEKYREKVKKLAEEMKEYTNKMAEANAHLVEIRREVTKR